MHLLSVAHFQSSLLGGFAVVMTGNGQLTRGAFMINDFLRNPNFITVLKDVNRFGKHAFTYDSSDDFRFYPRNSIQFINPGFKYSGHTLHQFTLSNAGSHLSCNFFRYGDTFKLGVTILGKFWFSHYLDLTEFCPFSFLWKVV